MWTHFDVATINIARICILTLVGLLLLWAWRQDQVCNSLIWWAFGFFTSTAALIFRSNDDSLPYFVSIEIGMALMIIDHGLIWSGIRSFLQRSIPWKTMIGFIILWVALYPLPIFDIPALDRLVIMTLLSATYVVLIIIDLITGRAVAPRSQYTAVVLLLVHLLALGLRVVLIITSPYLRLSEMTQWKLNFIILEPMLLDVALGFVLLNMIRESVENQQNYEAATDGLTRVLNRQGFFKAASKIHKRSTKKGKSLAVLMFDLDYFKKINDTYGHATGDEVLKVFCERISQDLREKDILGRIGGEEFVVLLQDVNPQMAETIAKRMLVHVSKNPIIVNDTPILVTASIGVICVYEISASMETLLEIADRALYQAKEEGRNRIVMADTDDLEKNQKQLAH